jgi:hypothetical protein
VSEENVEIYRALTEDFIACQTQSDWQGWIERLAPHLDPDVKWEPTLPLDLAPCHGRAAVLQFWRAWLAAWETLTFDYELLDADDAVVMLLDQRMRGRASGIEVSMGKYAHVVTFRDGLIVHWKAYDSQSDALKAVGLDP